MTIDKLVEEHGKRIGDIENDMKPLYSLPGQMEQVIEGIKDTNQSIKDLAKVSPTKEVCSEKHKAIEDHIKEYKRDRILAVGGFIGILLKIIFGS